MEAFDAYILYLALKRHFAINSGYDYFKYNGKTNASKSSFETRRDKYSFHKLSKKSKPKEFLVSNFIKHGTNVWITDLVTDSRYEETYTQWLKRRESISYVFQNELDLIEDLDGDLTCTEGGYPRLLELYMRGKVCIETLIILSEILGFFKKWNKEISDPIIWPEIYNTCIKYRPFMEYDREKLKKILIESVC